MKVRVSVVASWDGWCGDCAAERPLVLTRTGRRSLRAWWDGADDLPLTLTCKVCGVGVDVPLHEEDDPEVVEETVVPVVAAPVPPVVEEPAWRPVLVGEPDPAPVPVAPHDDAQLQAGRQAVADVLAALVASASASTPAAAPADARTDDALHLLAGGLDLLADDLPRAASA